MASEMDPALLARYGITQAQYDALSPDEKTNAIYVLTMRAAQDDGASPIDQFHSASTLAPGTATPASTGISDSRYQMGANVGMTPQQVIDQIANTGMTDARYVQQVSQNASNTLNNQAMLAYGGAQGALAGSANMAAEQQQLGQQGLGMSTALSDYYNQVGAQAAQAGQAGQAGANQTSAYYGQQQAGGVANQAYLQDQTIGALNASNQVGQQSMQALYGGANAANQAAGYYGGQSANYGQQSQDSSASAASGYGALYGQGQQNQNQLNQAASNVEQYGAQAAQQVAGHGLANEDAIKGIAGQQNQMGGAYANTGMQQLGNSGDDRASALGAVNRLQNFYQQGPGPSAAQAQLQQASDQNMSNALSLARSGRGAGDNAAAMRQAMFTNAATQQQTGMQMAQLRAQEDANWRGQQLQAMSQEQGTLGNLRGQDIGAAQTYGQLGAGYDQLAANTYMGGAQMGQSALEGGRNMGIGAAQLAQQYRMGGAQLGQAATQGAAGGMTQLGGQQISGMQTAGQLGLGYGGLGAQETQTAGQLGLGYGGMTQNALQGLGSQNVAMTGQAGQLGLGYGQLGEGYMQAGNQAQQGMSGLAQQSLGTGLGYEQGMYGQANAAMGQGLNAYTNMMGQGGQLVGQAVQTGMQGAGLAAGFDQASLNEQTGVMGTQLNADMQRYGADRQVAIATMQQDSANQAALIGGLAAFGGGLMTLGTGGATKASDQRVKKSIRSRVFDLRPAKGFAYEYIDPEMPGADPGTHFGPMAQDLEKTHAGRSVVRNVNGTKMVDTSRLALVLTGAMSEQQRDTDTLRERLARLEAMSEAS